MNHLDILSIDTQIYRYFETEEQNLHSYQARVEELHRLLSLELSIRSKQDLESELKSLQIKVDNIQTKRSLHFYIAESTPYLEEYRRILSKPMKINFCGGTSKEKTELEVQKRKIISTYLSIAKKYTEISHVHTQMQLQKESEEPKTRSKTEKCEHCHQCNFETDGNFSICRECGAQKENEEPVSSYKDIDRATVTTKYTYDRKIHFRDSIYQYQGKQNSTIQKRVYDDLIEQFQNHHLLEGDEQTPREIRFAKIEKEHIYMFLGETGHTKHYEDVNLIYHNLTGKPLDDISHLEEQLLVDFDTFIKEYDKKFKHTKKIDRKNSLNTQYLLYQFLKRHKHPCRKEDFNMLKTLELKALHDQITSEIFASLGWNMTSALF